MSSVTPPTSDSPALTSDFESMKESNDSNDLLDLIVRNPLGGPVIPGSPRQLTTPPVSAAYQFISPIPSPALGGVKQQQQQLLQHGASEMKDGRKVSHSPQLCTPPLPTATTNAEQHFNSPHHMHKSKLTHVDAKEHRNSPHHDRPSHHSSKKESSNEERMSTATTAPPPTHEMRIPPIKIKAGNLDHRSWSVERVPFPNERETSHSSHSHKSRSSSDRDRDRDRNREKVHDRGHERSRHDRGFDHAQQPNPYDRGYNPMQLQQPLQTQPSQSPSQHSQLHAPLQQHHSLPSPIPPMSVSSPSNQPGPSSTYSVTDYIGTTCTAAAATTTTTSATTYLTTSNVDTTVPPPLPSFYSDSLTSKPSEQAPSPTAGRLDPHPARPLDSNSNSAVTSTSVDASPPPLLQAANSASSSKTSTAVTSSSSSLSRPVSSSFLMGKNRPTGALFSGSRPVGALFQKDPTSPSAAKPEPPKPAPQPDPAVEIFSSLLAFRRPADRHRSASHETSGKGKSMEGVKRDSPQQPSVSQVNARFLDAASHLYK